MKTRLYYGLLLWLACICNANASNVITLNTTGDPPLNTTEQTGFLDLIAKEAFSLLDIKLITVRLPAERGLVNANSGIQDGEMSRVEGLELTYKNLIRVPEKIMDWEFVAFSVQDIELDGKWENLNPYSVAYINGWKIVEKNVTSPEIIKVHSSDQLFSLLNKNRTDIIIYERWAGLLLKQQLNLANIKIASKPFATKAMFVYLHKDHAALVLPLAEALKKIKANGYYQQIVGQVLTPLE